MGCPMEITSRGGGSGARLGDFEIIRELVKSRLAAAEASAPSKGLRGMMTRRSKR